MSKNIDPDPERLIYDYVRPFFPVPAWVPANSYSECHACHSKFSSGHRHNCRLCGQLFCSACSAKYHIPPEYEQKKKTGPARVCHGCKDSAMERGKQAAQERAAGNPNGVSTLVAMTDASMTPERLTTLEARSNRSSTIVKNSKTGRVVFYPPVWVPLESQSDCYKCREPFGKKKKHHCRTCGRMFCENCSSKMALPDAYLAPKNKSGPARVCDMCRFLIKSGATLSSDAAPTELPPPRTHAPSEAVPIPASLAKLGDTALTVLWDSNVNVGGGSFVAELSDKTRKKTLKQLHSALLDARPELSEHPFVYTYRGIVIPTEFHEVFAFEHLAPKLIIRPDEPEVVKSASNNTLLAYKQIAEHSRSPSEMSSLSNFDAYAEPKSETNNKNGTLTRVPSFTTPPSATQINSHIRTANNIRGLPAVDENNTSSVSESSPSNSQNSSRAGGNESLRSASVAMTPTSPNAASGINSVSASTILRRRAKVVSYVISLYPYEKKSDPAHLQCDAGELILISRRDNDQWWFGEVHRSGARGWVPASYVQVIPKPEEIEEEESRLRTLAAMEEKQQQQQIMKAALPISASGTFSSRPLSPKARRGLDDVAAQINRAHVASSESYRTLPMRSQSSARQPLPSGFESDSGSGDDVPPPPPPQQSSTEQAQPAPQPEAPPAQPQPVEYADVKHNENEPQETWESGQPAATKPIFISLPKPPSMSNLNISPSNAAANANNISMSAQRARTASTQEMSQVLKARSQLFK